jgi:hypothetical protein
MLRTPLIILALAAMCLGSGSFVGTAQEPAAKAEAAKTEPAKADAVKAEAPKTEAVKEVAKPAAKEQPAKADGNKPEKPKADKPSGEKSAVKPAVKRLPGPPPNFTPEREAAALAFANQHHAELVTLLAALKERNRNEYERAIGELWRTSERLATSREKDPERHALELVDWKLNSRIQLLAARFSMNESPAVEEELRAAIKEQTTVRIKVLELDRDRAATRAKKLEEQIQAANAGVDEEVNRRVGNLVKGVRQKTAERAARIADKAGEGKGEKPESKTGVKSIEKKGNEAINATVVPKVAPK